jgi:peptide/nickel transport system substrate-binding protein
MPLLVLLIASPCGPSAPSAGAPRANDQASVNRPADAPPKQITVGILQEPKAWSPWQEATTAGGAAQVPYFIRRTLSILDDKGLVQPEIAQAVPTLERGDWRLNADGTMEQTWKLRPNVKWHDGTPLTSDDFVFSYEIQSSPIMPRSISTGFNLISGARALDPETVVFTFKESSPLAGQSLLDPLPRHILGEAFAAGDVDGVLHSDHWTTAYVGNGPFRLANWQPGASQTFTAFDDFYMGKPKIATVVVRFLTDNNTLLANVLSGGVDVALPDGLSIESAAELKNGWGAPGTGNNVVIYADGRHYYVEFQHRPDFAKPSAARDPRVRTAFYYTLDKEGVNEVETAGLGLLADSWLPPNDARRPQFADSIPEWSFDIARASRILEDAGWRKGGDGILVNTGSGERMETEIRVTNTTGHVKALAVIANGWQQVGAAVTQITIPAAQVSDQQYRSSFSFAGLSGYYVAYYGWESYRYSCNTASGPTTRWLGHRDGYCGQTVQPLIERLDATIPDAERIPLQAQIMRTILKEDMAGPPLYWQVSPVVFAKGITGPSALDIGHYGATWSAWNAHLWDRTN